jgi:hypothetical protein
MEGACGVLAKSLLAVREHLAEPIETMLGLQVWSHSLYLAILAQAHEHGRAHGHKH